MPVEIRSILAATDLSPVAEAVLRSAAHLAELTGAKLHVVYALEASRAIGGEPVLDLQRRIHDARAALRQMIGSALPAETRISTEHVAVDRAATAILERAAAVQADLIVLGPHRTRAVGDQVLGTTADRLGRDARVPCLVVRRPISEPLRQIMVPSDLSDVARDALIAALQWGQLLQGPENVAGAGAVTALHVTTDAGGDAEDRALQADLDGEIAAARAHAPPGATLQLNSEVLKGASPVEEILRYTRERADLLVMGTRGDRPLMKMLLRSVSAAVARETEVPLLLIPPSVRIPGVVKSGGRSAATV